MADNDPGSDALYATFIDASHILHYHGVVDAYGHISIRNPRNPSTFFMSRNLAPALISSRADILEYNISDASPVDPNAKPGYSERCIHSEILKRYPGVNSVIHSHCADILPYCVSSVPLKPTIHMAGFLSSPVPLWDITPHYATDDGNQRHRADLLVRTPRLGAALASAFCTDHALTTLSDLDPSLSSPSAANQPADHPLPSHTTLLMRGHGFTTAAPTVHGAVFQAVYTGVAARTQTSAMVLQNAFGVASVMGGGGVYRGDGAVGEPQVDEEVGLWCLNRQEREGTWEMNRETVGRPWGLWVREVRSRGLYRNEEAGIVEEEEEEEEAAAERDFVRV
ncbi:class II aldolase and Adducin N-terminal domain-containing protein [Macrophomina phaseolina]|uniref:Class II aldolase and Adducin N-terminal domain-containing protein n=1 Tax=Macrophomina phaseolina TaxID=35725 RepID=A0ABQ8GNQ7_9PEZI|nr:class II aldolase and Adducin N-terminal domain-containing protein [Macrophomina phaseolina]